MSHAGPLVYPLPSTLYPLPSLPAALYPLGRRLIIRLIAADGTLRLVRHRSWVRLLIEPRLSASTARMSPPAAAWRAATLSLAFALGLRALRCGPASTSAVMHARSASQHLFSTGGEHCLERLDAIVGRFKKKVLDDGLSALELRDEHFRVRPARHFTAHLRHHPIPARSV